MIAFFARHPTAANLLMIVFFAMGLLSLSALRRETFPDFSRVEVEVRVLYPGATAEEIEEAVCQRVEDAIDRVRFVKELRSDAREGIGVITAEMEPAGDPLTFRSDIETEVRAIDDLPDNAEEPVIAELNTTEQVLALIVSCETTAAQLKEYCEDLKRRLQRLPGVSMVTVEGFSRRQLLVEPDPLVLRSLGVSASDVATVIGRQSVDLPAGTVETPERDYTIRFAEERRSVEELERLTVKSGVGGAELRLGDLARVRDTFENQEEKALLEGRRAGYLRVEKTKNQDTIRVAKAVKGYVEREKERQPNVDIRITQDVSTLVQDRLRMLLKNAAQGIALVFLVLWLFFDLRLSFWVAMSIPVSFLGAFFFMPHLDLTVNMLTMVGMLLALGLLMDDGIVIAENISTHRARGKSALDASIDGVSEVRPGVTASFLTTICVLGPLAFLDGRIGDVLEVVPMVLVLVLAVSLVEAFMILPAHLGHSRRPVGQETVGRFRRRFDRGIEWVRERVLGRTVDRLIEWRYAWLGAVAGAFLVSIAMLADGVLEFRAFPDLDGDTIEARVLLPQGTTLARTEAIVDRITNALDRVNERYRPRQPDGSDLVETVYVRFNRNPDAFETGPHVATVTADLLGAERRDGRIDDLLAAWRDESGEVTDVLSISYTEPGFGPAGRPIEVRLAGEDLSRLKEAATRVRSWFAAFEGVYNLADDLRPGKEEIIVSLREGALGMGLDASAVARQLRAAVHGILVTEIQVGREAFRVEVRPEAEGRDSVSAIEQMDLVASDGRLVPLLSVVRVERDRGWGRIARVDGRRAITVRGDLDPRLANTARLFRDFRQEVTPELRAAYPGLTISLEGETRESAETQGSMLRAAVIGLIGIFVLLSFQFRSYLEPIVVMAAIPLALVGVIWGHLLLGHDLSMPSLLGFVSLAGVVVNDSILLVLFLKLERERGSAVNTSAAQASRQRFRAVLLTSLTTIAGLLPLLAERSLQAQILIPLAVSITFGMMASTVLVLLVIPPLYVVLADLGLVRSRETPIEDPGTA